MNINEVLKIAIEMFDDAREDDEYKKAMRGFTAILEEDPNHFEALFYAGNCSVMLEDFQSALEYFEKMGEVRPEEKPWVHIGDILLQLRRNKDALNAFNKALAIEASSDAFIGKAFACFKLKDYVQCEEAFDDAIACAKTENDEDPLEIEAMKIEFLANKKD